MRTVTYRLADLQRAVIPIGFVGENEHTRVIFDCKRVFDEYPAAVAALTVQPPVGEAYPAVVVRDGDTVYWDIYDSDLIEDGSGEAQLTFSEGETVVKSFVFRTKVDRSIVGSGEVPEPLDDFLARAGEALTAIPQTIQDTFGEISAEAETLPAGSSATASFDSENMKLSFGIPAGEKGDPGDPGDDGFSPIASVSKSGDTATISITDKNGTTTAEITDGQDGHPGDDGYSPTAIVTKTGSVATITLIDKNGTTSAQISDGTPGDPTQLIDDTAGAGDTSKVWSADKSASENQALNGAINSMEESIAPVESSATATAAHAVGELFILDDSLLVALSAIAVGDTITTTGGSPNAAVTTLSAKLIKDVQVNGTTILSQGVANIPMPDNTTFGVVKVGSSAGVGIGIDANGRLQTQRASGGDCKLGTHNHAPVTPAIQHESVFYALSKVAGEDLKNDNVTTGTYPEKSKSAIHQMLDAPETVSGSTPSITAKSGVRYICGEVSTLTIVVPASGIIDVVFESGSTPTVLTVTPPTGVTMKWANNFDPTNLDANTTYEINILDGEFGVVGKWT